MERVDEGISFVIGGFLSYKHYVKELKEDALKPLNGFYGTEAYIMRSMIDLTKDKYLAQGFEEMDYSELSGKNLSFSEAKNAVSTYPFMSSKRIVVIEKPDFLMSEKWGRDKIDEFFEIVNSNKALILIFLFEDIDRRKYGIKRLDKLGSLREFGRITKEELEQWLVKRFKHNKKRIAKRALEYMVINSGYHFKENPPNDLYSLEKLVDLISLSKEAEEIGLDDVTKYMESLDEPKLFEWRDALLMGESEKATVILHSLIRNKHPMTLSAIVRTQLRSSFSYSLLREAGFVRTEVFTRMQIKEFVSQSLEALYRLYGLSGLRLLLSYAVELDERLKIGSIDALLAFDLFSQKIASIRPTRTL